MPRPMSEYYREMAAKIEADEKADRDAAAEEKLKALEARALSDDDTAALDWVRKFRAELEKDDDDEEDGEEKAKPKAVKKDEAPVEEPKAKTRPGRKKGQAYGWWVDDDGKVYKLKDGAKIWSGADEPDEVEIPEPAPEPKEDEAAA